jgi:hypothetical protein
VEKIISKLQNAFLRDRQILDSIFIVNEYLDSWIRSGDPDVLCKLDMEARYEKCI